MIHYRNSYYVYRFFKFLTIAWVGNVPDCNVNIRNDRSDTFQQVDKPTGTDLVSRFAKYVSSTYSKCLKSQSSPTVRERS